jgi:hypothetical protein
MTAAKRLIFLLLLGFFALGVYLRHAEHAIITAQPLLAVVVEDSAHRTPAIGAVLTDPDLLAFITQKKIDWHVIDRSETGPDLGDVQFALNAAKNCGLPALVLRSGAGKPKVVALPSTAAACMALLKRSAG